jgi:hypothetical protein
MVKKLLNYEFIKENISLILLIPTALGGFWQIIELAYVGVPYIRFFSISQLLADGLLILFVIVVAYLVIQITLSDSSNHNGPNEVEEAVVTKEAESNKSLIKKLTFNGLILGLFIYFYCKSLFDKIATKDRMSTLEVCLALFGVVIVCMFVGIVTRYLSKLIDVKKLAQSEYRKWAMVIIAPTLFYVICKSLIFLIPRMHNSYLIPENLKNIEYVSCRIRKLNPDLKSYKIAYFNDKYIFVDISLPKNSVKTEVLKFDEFFSDACQTPKTNVKISE